MGMLWNILKNCGVREQLKEAIKALCSEANAFVKKWMESVVVVLQLGWE